MLHHNAMQDLVVISNNKFFDILVIYMRFCNKGVAIPKI